MAWYEEQKCPICGKMFTPAPQHSLTDGHGHFVCSPHCSESARKADEGKMKIDYEKCLSEDKERERKRSAYQKKKRVEPLNRSGHVKSILIYDSKGNFIKKVESQKTAADHTGVSKSRVSMICNGMCESCNGFSFRYEDDIMKHTKRYQY